MLEALLYHAKQLGPHLIDPQHPVWTTQAIYGYFKFNFTELKFLKINSVSHAYAATPEGLNSSTRLVGAILNSSGTEHFHHYCLWLSALMDIWERSVI